MNHRRFSIIVCILLITCTIFCGCKRKNAAVKVAKPELTEEQIKTAKNVEPVILRYEQDLFNIDQNKMAISLIEDRKSVV